MQRDFFGYVIRFAMSFVVLACIMRSARNLAASTKVLLFIIVSACNGVVVRSLRTVQISRAAALKVIIVGGGTVRRQ